MFENEVARGIQALDEDGPVNWRERVVMTTLNMASSDDCVLGQVYGHYSDHHASALRERHGGGVHCGFQLRGLGSDPDYSMFIPLVWRYQELTQEWCRQLAAVPVA